MFRSRFVTALVNALLLSGLAVFAGCGGTSSPSSTPAAGSSDGAGDPSTGQPAPESNVPKPDVTVTAEQLANDYASDEDAADQKYNGKTVRLTGIVEKVTTDDIGVTVVQLQCEAKVGVACGIPADAARKAEGLKQGQEVTLQGNCFGKLGDEVTVNACEFVE